MMRLAGTVNYKTGQHARIVEADFALPAYPLAELVGELPDPSPTRRAEPPAGRVRRRRGSLQADRAARVLPAARRHHRPARRARVAAPPPATSTAHPSCSVGAEASAGLVLPQRRLRGARRDLRPRLRAARRPVGPRAARRRRSRAPARACARRSAMSPERTTGGDDRDARRRRVALRRARAGPHRRTDRRPRRARVHEPAGVARERARAGRAAARRRPAPGRTAAATWTRAVPGGRRTITLAPAPDRTP